MECLDCKHDENLDPDMFVKREKKRDVNPIGSTSSSSDCNKLDGFHPARFKGRFDIIRRLY